MCEMSDVWCEMSDVCVPEHCIVATMVAELIQLACVVHIKTATLQITHANNAEAKIRTQHALAQHSEHPSCEDYTLT